MKSRLLRIFLIVSIIFINIGCDQVSKRMVRKNILFYENIGYFNNHLIITKVENTGAFLSVGNGLSRSKRKILLLAIPAVLLALGFIYLLFKSSISKATLTGFSFVIGGGIANIFDRIYYGSVTDFLYIDFGFFHTGVFNLADLSIVIGVLIVLIHSLLRKKHSALKE
jgi:signal peptidase II